MMGLLRVKYFDIFGGSPDYRPVELEPGAPLPRFDYDAHADRSWTGWIAGVLFFKIVGLIGWLSRTFFPVIGWGGLYFVGRDADVRATLKNTATFNVPYGPEMTALTGGATFLLGLDGPDHDRQREIIWKVMHPEDLEALSVDSGRFARALLENSAGKIDVMKDLLTRTVTETCVRFFGFSVDDPDAFAEWSLSTSWLLFGDPFGNAETRRLALNGGARMLLVIKDAVARAKKNHRDHPDTERSAAPLADRLITLQERDHSISDEEIYAILFGLVVGFIPTITLGAGKMMEELLRHPAVLLRAQLAARKCDRSTVEAILREAGRLNPALAPGQWRWCPDGGRIGKKDIPPGSVLMVSTMSALRDARRYRNPGRFDHSRTECPDAPDLSFGDGAHDCIGKQMALVQITSIFLELLGLPGLRAIGKIDQIGPFPRRLDMVFDHPGCEQHMIVIRAKLNGDVTGQEAQAVADALGNPASPALKTALDATGIVHFASLSVITDDESEETGMSLLFEINADGPEEKAIDAVAAHAGELLSDVFRLAGFDSHVAFADFLKARQLRFHGWPWGATSVQFLGTAEFSVGDIECHKNVAALAREAVDSHMRRKLAFGTRATNTLWNVRRIFAGDYYNALMHDDRAALIAKARSTGLDAALMKPSRRRLLIADWTAPESQTAAFLTFLRARDGGLPAVIGLTTIAITFAVSLWRFIDPPPLHGTTHWLIVANLDNFGWAFIGSLLGGAVLTMLLTSFVLLVAYLRLRALEKADVSEGNRANMAALRDIAAREDDPGQAQNHIVAIGTIKRGLFRRLVNAFALWGIGALVRSYFRPGFVLSMGTIHFARWFSVPGTSRVVFFSNYDGSWESYLEDFITRARWGQTASWSNWKGFPKTRDLAFEGAEDGDRFKRWVRTQQIPTRFWYSRFPDLTTEQIRNNALIHDGLTRAQNDTQARAWLSCFGSEQRQDAEIEASEVQSLVFTGHKSLIEGRCLILALSQNPADCAKWLGDFLKGHGKVNFGDKLQRVSASPQANGVADKPPAEPVSYVAFSAHGLAAFGMPDAEAGCDGLASMPGPFVMGMSNRSRVLGDTGKSDPAHWHWRDAACQRTDLANESDAAIADAAVIVYAETLADLDQRCDEILADLVLSGGRAISQLQLPSEQGATGLYEKFGFRDGISQPIIRGTRKISEGALDKDVVEAGEFILGYRANQGRYPPTPVVRSELDIRNDLPITRTNAPSRFPGFGKTGLDEPQHDFGRNGTFVVIRELQQDKEAFDQFTASKADEIRSVYRDGIATAVGEPVTSQWVAEKMVGRRIHGAPLVGDPTGARLNVRDRAPTGLDNDFLYGVDDPRGLQCPLGAHVRRANPRDSLEPGDKTELTIANRHRLLRRGRSYVRGASSTNTAEEGLLFVAMCADLERQYEFVQQSWINGASFHGLERQPDPFAFHGETDFARTFDIPTPDGTIHLDKMDTYVTMRGGGYFFLPSRSALKFLVSLGTQSI